MTTKRPKKKRSWGKGEKLPLLKRQGGRPSEYDESIIPEIRACAEQGMSIFETCFTVGISKQTWHNWAEQHQEFMDATLEHAEITQAWWEMMGRVGLVDPKFNTGLYRLNMLNRFSHDWRMKRTYEIDVSEDLAGEMRLARARAGVADE